MEKLKWTFVRCYRLSDVVDLLEELTPFEAKAAKIVVVEERRDFFADELTSQVYDVIYPYSSDD